MENSGILTDGSASGIDFHIRVVVQFGVGVTDCAITDPRPKIGCQSPTAKQAAANTEPSAVAPDARVNFGIKPIG
jgi:hypothetical protein